MQEYITTIAQGIKPCQFQKDKSSSELTHKNVSES